MRIAHIIMAHKNPEQLLRLIKSLEHPNSDFFIHIDAKVAIEDFNIIYGLDNVFFISKREKCTWGGNNFLLAILNSLEEVCNQKEKYEFANLISAQDYPLVSPNKLYNYLEKKKGYNFIYYTSAENSDWWKSAVSRYEKFHFTDFNFKYKYLLERLVNILAPKRKFPLTIELFGGSKSSWWTISLECAMDIILTVKNQPELMKFLKYSWGSDEFVIPSLIMNSKHKSKTINNNLRYIDWSEGNAHPKLLIKEDFDKINSTENLFARKFDTQVDSEILDLIDKKLLKE